MIETTLVAVRTVHFLAVLGLVGAITFRFAVAAPALGGAPSTLDIRFRRFAATAWIVAVVSGCAWLAVLGERIGGTTATDALLGGTDWTLLTRTQFGLSWIFRGAVALALGLALLRRHPKESPAGASAIALSVALAGSLAWSGHGAATPGPIGDLQLAADIVHLIAAGLWLGGLLPFATVLLLAKRGGIPVRSAAEITKRFSAVAALSVGLLVLSGIFNSWVLIRDISGLTGTLYGRLLLAKVGLFLVMICFAAANKLVLSPRLASTTDPVPLQLRHLAVNSLVELVVGIGVVSIVGLLGTLPPAIDRHMTSTATIPGSVEFVRNHEGG